MFYAKFLVEPLFEQKFITDCISTKVKINSFMRIYIQINTFVSKTAQIFKIYQNFLVIFRSSFVGIFQSIQILRKLETFLALD